MNKQEHTPGPWEVTRSKMPADGAFDYAISGPDGAQIIAEAFGRDANGGWPPAEANAHLIAAAPELLRALHGIAGWSKCQCVEKHGDNENCCVLIAERAIAKAEEVRA